MASRREHGLEYPHPLRLTQLGDQPGSTNMDPTARSNVVKDVALALLLERDGRPRLSPIEASSYVKGTDLTSYLPREIWRKTAAAAVARHVDNEEFDPEQIPILDDEQKVFMILGHLPFLQFSTPSYLCLHRAQLEAVSRHLHAFMHRSLRG